MEKGSPQPNPEIDISIPRNESNDAGSEVEFEQLDEEGFFIRVNQDFTETLPTALQNEIKENSKKMFKLLAPIRRFNILRNRMKAIHDENPGFLGVHNNKNGSSIAIYDGGSRVIDDEKFKETLGSLYPFAIKGEKIIIEIETEVNGRVIGTDRKTGRPTVVEVFDLVKRVPEALINKGVDESEARKRVQITKIPVVNWDKVHALEASSEVVFPPGVIENSVTLKMDKTNKPIDQTKIRKPSN